VSLASLTDFGDVFVHVSDICCCVVIANAGSNEPTIHHSSDLCRLVATVYQIWCE